MNDPDAPGGTVTHWVLFDVPAAVDTMGADSTVGIDGKNDFQAHSYGGPCPPPTHNEHRYYFRLKALAVESLQLAAGAERASVEQPTTGNRLAETTLMGRYKRA